MNKIVEYTNSQAQIHYAKSPTKETSHQKDWVPITKAELKAYLTLMIHMGITPAPHYRFYWTKDEQFRILGIANIMQRDRFEKIKKFIYFNNLEEATKSKDGLRKIKTVYDAISKSCKDYWIHTGHLSINESMIPYAGDHSGTVYLPRKPIPNGFKMHVLADLKDMLLIFFI